MKENIKNEIIKHTLRMISEKGFDGFSVDELTGAAGCSKGIVFYHFTDRSKLVLAAFAAFLEHYNTLAWGYLKEGMTAAGMLDLLTAILIYPERFGSNNEAAAGLGIGSDDYPRLLVNFYYLCLKSPEAATIQKDMYKSYYEGIRQILDYGVGTGEFQPKADISRIIFGFSAMVDGLILYQSLKFEYLDDDSISMMISDYWKNNLGC